MKSFLSSIALATVGEKGKIRVQNVKIAGKRKSQDEFKEKDAVFWINMAYQGLKDESKYIFGLTLKSNSDFIGGISLSIEKPFDRGMIGYWIAEPYWNLGYASEATAAIIKFGFDEIGLNKIYSNHLAKNPASGKVMTNNGMIKEGELKDHIRKGNTYHTLIQYRLTKSEYQNT